MWVITASASALSILMLIQRSPCSGTLVALHVWCALCLDLSSTHRSSSLQVVWEIDWQSFQNRFIPASLSRDWRAGHVCEKGIYKEECKSIIGGPDFPCYPLQALNSSNDGLRSLNRIRNLEQSLNYFPNSRADAFADEEFAKGGTLDPRMRMETKPRLLTQCWSEVWETDCIGTRRVSQDESNTGKRV